jgi:hypothetical protein
MGVGEYARRISTAADPLAPPPQTAGVGTVTAALRASPSKAFIGLTRVPDAKASGWPIERQPVAATRIPTKYELSAWFLPQGWEVVAKRQAEDLFVSDPPEYARIHASLLASEAMRQPQYGAALAGAFIARCTRGFSVSGRRAA